MTKQQENRAFVKMLKEFPKAFGRVSFRERLMLRTAFNYINEEVIADIKANCDYVLEDKDLEIKQLKMTDEYIIKTLESKVEKLQEDLRNKRISIKNKKAEINELKLELTVEKDQHQEEVELHLHAEEYSKELEEENNKLLDVINNQDVKIADLEKENAELRNNGFTVSAMTEQQLKVALEKGEQLEKENAELKGRNEGFEQQIMGLLIKYEEVYKRFPDLKDAMNEAERVLKENAELKSVCQDLSDKFDFQVKQVMKLEKENAYLKERYDRVDIIGYDALKNLTKAKELLKRFLGLGNLWNLDCKDYFPLRKEVEQFLEK